MVVIVERASVRKRPAAFLECLCIIPTVHPEIDQITIHIIVDFDMGSGRLGNENMCRSPEKINKHIIVLCIGKCSYDALC